MIQTNHRRRKQETFTLDDDPLWYKDALIYEVHVRAFYDSDLRWLRHYGFQSLEVPSMVAGLQR